MRQDLERWDGRYHDPDQTPVPDCDPVLVAHADLLPVGDALDVACGLGQNAMWLAARGHRVLGVDGSAFGLRRAAEAARRAALPVRWLCADLDFYTPAANAFDLILVVRFLNRALIPRLLRALRPGGVIFYRTFNVNRSREGDRFPSDYLLGRGELRRLLAGLEVLAGNDAEDITDLSSWLLARKPERAS